MNVRLTWQLPVPTARQRALKHVRIEGRVDGVAQWGVIDAVAVPATDLVIEDIAPGTWQFRGIVVDIDDRESAPVETSVDVPFDGPSPLVSLSAAVE